MPQARPYWQGVFLIATIMFLVTTCAFLIASSMSRVAWGTVVPCVFPSLIDVEEKGLILLTFVKLYVWRICSNRDVMSADAPQSCAMKRTLQRHHCRHGKLSQDKTQTTHSFVMAQTRRCAMACSLSDRPLQINSLNCANEGDSWKSEISLECLLYLEAHLYRQGSLHFAEHWTIQMIMPFSDLTSKAFDFITQCIRTCFSIGLGARTRLFEGATRPFHIQWTSMMWKWSNKLSDKEADPNSHTRFTLEWNSFTRHSWTSEIEAANKMMHSRPTLPQAIQIWQPHECRPITVGKEKLQIWASRRRAKTKWLGL